MAYTAGDKHFAAERSHGPYLSYLRSLDTLNMPLRVLPLECSLSLGRPWTVHLQVRLLMWHSGSLRLPVAVAPPRRSL